MENRKISKIVLVVLAVTIISAICIFGYNAYQSFQPVKFDTSKVEVLVAKGAKDNEYIVTVDTKQEGVYISQYSFDNGETWQYDNKYIATDNKTLQIKLKDIEGNIIGEVSKTIGEIDREGPVIKVTLPSEIKQNASIDLAAYVSVEDPSGIKGAVVINPSVIDTSVVGIKKITYKAVDNLNNETVVTVEINVVKDSNLAGDQGSSGSSGNTSKPSTGGSNSSGSTTKPNTGGSGSSGSTSTSSKVTYYRFRTKTINTYACNYHRCDYKDTSNTKALKVKFDSNSYCCNQGSCNKYNDRVAKECLPNENCIAMFVNQYSSQGNVCYETNSIINYIPAKKYYKKNCSSSDEIKIDGYCYKIESIGTSNSSCSSLDCVSFNKSSPCSGKTKNPTATFLCDREANSIQSCISGPRYQVYQKYCYDATGIIIEEPAKYEYKKSCSSNEILVNGACHIIDSKGDYYCDSGYTKDGNKCVKVVEKTCSDTCKSEVWSSWSKWSTTKVVPSSTVQVETKVE